MIHGWLDSADAPPSDDEYEGGDLEFAFNSSAKAEDAPRSACKTVIVAGPGAPTAFVLSAFGKLQEVSWLFDLAEGQEAPIAPPLPPRPPKFYVASEGRVAVVLLDSPVAQELAPAWTEAFLDGFPADATVLFLGHIYRTEFCAIGAERPQEPHLCGLWTAAVAPPACNAVAELPVPNVVGGVAAALLTHCEGTKRRCLVALTLQDGAHLGEGCVRAFERLLPFYEEAGLASKDWKAPDYRDALRKVVPQPKMGIYA
eukprot:TRINITY_DN105386_c0_g1_i1.p1 TRINITY_DN105386_c0_g1~~TRINITY_DN105386_c0_g1_i1.p1  ORF type:complete len:257 (-),score=50.85 TRINITY_DN105386_c0_g1_i1:148-918(-)